jgi:hypothetical protein
VCTRLGACTHAGWRAADRIAMIVVSRLSSCNAKVKHDCTRDEATREGEAYETLDRPIGLTSSDSDSSSRFRLSRRGLVSIFLQPIL